MLFFAVLAFGLIGSGIAFMYWAATGMRTGIVISREGRLPREQHPIRFWMYVTMYSMVAPMSLLAGLICVRAITLGCAPNSTIHTCNVFQSLW